MVRHKTPKKSLYFSGREWGGKDHVKRPIDHPTETEATTDREKMNLN